MAKVSKMEKINSLDDLLSLQIGSGLLILGNQSFHGTFAGVKNNLIHIAYTLDIEKNDIPTAVKNIEQGKGRQRNLLEYGLQSSDTVYITNDCVFCEIIRGERSCAKLYETQKVFVFLDYHSINEGHALILPKNHAQSFLDIDEPTLHDMMSQAGVVYTMLQKAGLKIDGVNFLINDRYAAGQEIFHTHLHLIPRFLGDGFGLRMTGDYEKREPKEPLELADYLRKFR